MTPQDVVRAADASAVTLFPAGPIGPGYLAAVRAALPGISVIASGSVELRGTAGWFAAGAEPAGN